MGPQKKQSTLSPEKDLELLYESLLRLKDKAELRSFLKDLMTSVELREISDRFKAARMLSAGISYMEIIEATGLSSTTIARVASWAKKDSGGYQRLLRRMPNLKFEKPVVATPKLPKRARQ